MGLEKFLKIVLVGALMMCPFVMLGENTNEGSMVLSDSIAVADSVQPAVSLDVDTVFSDNAVAVELVDESTRFNAKQLILPGALVAVGSLGLIKTFKKVNEEIKTGVADARDGHYFHADDYLQYLPVVSTYGLSLLGAKARHSYLDRTFLIATSYLTMGILVNGLKYTVREPRPYNPNVRNSFPSGHTATAFMGAELVRMEYKDASVWYGVGAYVVASGIGVLRVWNERHWATDVLAGAGIGILSARVAYWLLPFERRLFGLDKKQKASDMVAIPYYSPTDRSFGASLALTF